MSIKHPTDWDERKQFNTFLMYAPEKPTHTVLMSLLNLDELELLVSNPLAITMLSDGTAWPKLVGLSIGWLRILVPLELLGSD